MSSDDMNEAITPFLAAHADSELRALTESPLTGLIRVLSEGGPLPRIALLMQDPDCPCVCCQDPVTGCVCSDQAERCLCACSYCLGLRTRSHQP